MLLRRHDGQRDRASAGCSPISRRPGSSRSSRAPPSLTMILNIVALWKQEARSRGAHRRAPSARLSRSLGDFIARPRTVRLLVAVGLGAGGVQHAGRAARALWRRRSSACRSARRRSLTALWAVGMLAGFAWRRAALGGGADPHRLAGFGGVVGIAAFLLRDLRRAAAVRSALLAHRRDADRLRRRAVLGRHADRGDGDRRSDGHDRPRARRLGRGAGDVRPGLRSRSAAFVRDAFRRAAVSGALGADAGRPGDRLRLRLAHRDRAAARHARRARPAGAAARRGPAIPRRFGLSEFPI